MASAIRCTSLAFAKHSSGCGTPRSAKTLPLLASTSILFRWPFFFAGTPFRMKLLRDLESPLDKLDFLLRGRHALLRFLLESMKHEDRPGEFYGIDGSIGIALVILDDFQDSGAAESFGGLASACFFPHWACHKAKPIVRRTSMGKALRSLLLDATQKSGLD